MNRPLDADLDAQALGVVEDCLDVADAAERARCVAERCAGSPDLQRRVERILAMEAAPFRLIPTEAIGGTIDLPEALPERIGAFRVTGLIGRGGMGTVVKAERDDGIYSQTVAIKLIRADVGDPRSQARFAQERRILARLSHPAIARILDGGASEGRPYLVMEYVDGVPVTVDLERRAAGLEATLDCFLQICDAVAHAHRQLVVHADIKPSNILVGADGVKLLDFGIARLTVDLDREELDGPYPLTRGYAPPERIAGSAPTIVGDVYSLGALLHEMLSGCLPDDAGDGKPSVAAAQGGGRFPAARLAGDLDAIVAQATQVDPAARYPDVGALASEIRRFRSGRPVAARGDRFGYVARCFVRRNRVPILLGLLVFTTLAASTAVSIRMFLDARDARTAAEARFEDVRALAKYQLFTLYDSLAATPGTVAAREQLTDEAQSYLNRLAAYRGASDELRLDVARGYNRLAGIQGVPSVANLGRVEEARANLDRGAAVLRGLIERQPDNRAAILELGRNRLMLADLALLQDNDMAAARTALAAGEPLVKRAQGGDSEWIRVEALRRRVHMDLLGWSESYARELVLADGTLAWLATLPLSEQWTVDHVIATAEAEFRRNEALYYLGRVEESLVAAERADALLIDAERRFPSDARLLAMRLFSGYSVITTLEGLRRRTGLTERSLALARIAERAVALEPNDLRIARRARNVNSLAAQLLFIDGRHDEAIAIQRGLADAEAVKLRARPADPRIARDYAVNMKILGEMHWEGGRREVACGMWRKAGEVATRLDRQKRLNDWDKTNMLVGLLNNLDVCEGRKPASAYRGGNL